MPERMESYRRVEDGDFRPLLRRMSAFAMAGLWEIVGDPVFADQACEVLSERKQRVVNLGSILYTDDSVLDIYR